MHFVPNPNAIHLYLYRHGETDWNRLGRIQGRVDIPLNELGRRQAEQVREFFNEYFLGGAVPSMSREDLYAGAVSSPLLRAQATARIVIDVAGSAIGLDTTELAMNLASATECGPRLRIDPRWSETHLGEAEGLTRDELVEKFGEESWRAWIGLNEASWLAKFPGGESKGEVRDRALAAMADLVRISEAGPSAPRVWTVATHGGLLRRVLHHFHPDETTPIDVPNGSVFKFVWVEGSWSVSSQPLFLPPEK